MTAQLTAVAANFSMCRPTKPFTVHDFMLHPPDAAEKAKPTKMTKKKRQAIAEQLRINFGSGIFGTLTNGDDRPGISETDSATAVSAS